MSSLITNHNPKTTTLDTVAKKKNLNYISKFRLSPNIINHIILGLILYDIYMDNPTIVLDIKFNL